MGPGAAGSGSVLTCEQGGVRWGVRLYISVFLPPLSAALMWHTVSSRGPIRNADSFPDPRDGYHCVQRLIPIQTPRMVTTVCRASLVSESTVLRMPLDTWVI